MLFDFRHGLLELVSKMVLCNEKRGKSFDEGRRVAETESALVV